MKKQLAYFLARARIPLSWVHTPEGHDVEGEGEAPLQPDDILACLGNVALTKHFKSFGKAVGVEEPRSIEDIYKSHLEQTRTNVNADSARNNLAATFVNAFVNAGFSNDKLVVNAPEGQSWIYKNKEHGMISATASIGMSMMWDADGGFDVLDNYTYSSEEHIKAGAYLAMGILHSNIQSDPDLCFALLEEHVDSASIPIKIAAMNGMAMAYAGSQRLEVTEKLMPYVADDLNTMDVGAMAALGLGFVWAGSGDGEIASSILQTMMEREPEQLESDWVIFMCLSLGLVFLGTPPFVQSMTRLTCRRPRCFRSNGRNSSRYRPPYCPLCANHCGGVLVRGNRQRLESAGNAADLLGACGEAEEGTGARGRSGRQHRYSI